MRTPLGAGRRVKDTGKCEERFFENELLETCEIDSLGKISSSSMMS